MDSNPQKKKVGSDGLTKDQRYYWYHQCKEKKVGSDGLTKDQRYYRKNKAKRMDKKAVWTGNQIIASSSEPDAVDDEIQALIDGFWSMSIEIDYQKLADLVTRENTSTLSPITYTGKEHKYIRSEVRSEEYLNSLDELLDIRRAVSAWSAKFGGVDNWVDTLELMFKRTVRMGKAWTKRFIIALLYHEEQGKEYIASLSQFSRFIPPHVHAAQPIFSELLELIQVLIRGTTIVQTRVHLVRRGLFAVGGTYFEKFVDAWLSGERYTAYDEDLWNSDDEKFEIEEETESDEEELTRVDSMLRKTLWDVEDPMMN